MIQKMRSICTFIGNAMIGIPIECVRLTTYFQSSNQHHPTKHSEREFDIRVLKVRNFFDEKKELDSEDNIQYIIYGYYKSLKRTNS